MTAGTGPGATGPADKDDAAQVLPRKLNYFIGQITPEEFRWQDANYDQDSALGRDLLFLIANNEWARATSEVFDIARSDAVDTTIKIDVDLSRIAHEAFRDRAGQLWLPVLVLPPLQSQSQSLEPDPFATCTVTDASGALLATLPNTDVRHRVAAALAEIIVNIAVARLPDLGQPGVSASRDQRLLLAAAIYRLLRSESVPKDVMTEEDAAVPQAPDGPGQRIGKARRALTGLLGSYAGLLEPGAAEPAQAAAAGQGDGRGLDRSPEPDHDVPERRVFARVLAERAIQVLDAFTKSPIVVVAADRARTPAVLTVTVPSRPLCEQRHTPGLLRWLWPSILNRVLPRARLEIHLLLPSADADRQVQVNLPDGVSFDPWQSRNRRAELDIRVGPPPPVTQLGYLMGQLTEAPKEWPDELYRALGDLTCAKAAATRETLRDHRVVPGHLRGSADPTPQPSTKKVGDRLDRLRDILSEISAALPVAAARESLALAWEQHENWLGTGTPMQRRTLTDTVSPDVVVTRARMIEDVSQRGAPYQATIGVQVAVTDSEYFSVARFSGSMSVLLMSVVFVFFLIGSLSGIASGQVSAEVLAFVLTLFSAVQVGRMERPDPSTLRGLLAQASNLLIGILILPTVVLAVALAFSRSLLWGAGWAIGCIAFQLLLQFLVRQRLRLDAGQQSRAPKALRTKLCILLRTDPPDYSHAVVLHSAWWRSTTADALLVGRSAHAYVVWQHDATLRSFLHSGRPASDPEPAAGSWSERWRWRRRAAGQLTQPTDVPQGDPDDSAPARPDPGAPSAGDLPPGDGPSDADAEPSASLLEQPANVLALQRSGTIAQSVTFAVFRDQPKGDWEADPKEVHQVVLDEGQLAPASDVSAVIGVFLGLPKGACLLTLADHPLTAVLHAAASDRNRLGVLEVQLPVPAPSVAYAELQWTRVQIGLRDGDYTRLTSFLDEVRALAARSAALGLVVGVQTVSEGIPRILHPAGAAANPGPAVEQAETGPARLVLASDLDVVAGSGLHRTERADEETWRLLAICSDWRSAEEIEILDGLDRGLRLAGLTTVILHGKLVILLLGHRPGGRGGDDDQTVLGPPGSDRRAIVYLDEWQSREQLGEGHKHPLLQVRMRTPDRAGATLEVIESLRETFQEMAPGLLTDQDWNVWYTRTVVTAGRAAVIQLTVRLAVDPATTPPDHPIECWGPKEMSKIERRALALAAGKMAARGAGSVADLGLDAPEDTVISVSLITTPDLGGPGVSDPGLTEAATAP